eukprot:TRINITY_DN2461_c0_g1_i1.p1 TRINITY_DN2461_c0_g1~~TRINITY_DN2461_c0_g1_i1.p1  ORF type:complete len:743 (+),score=174.94 TRINITY_DN2461_c0_g1_i1:144-2231(+)
MEDFSSFLEEVFTIEKWKKGKELGSGSNGTVRLVTLKDDLNLAVKRIASADNEVCSQREISLHKEAHRQKLSVPYLGAVHRGRHSYVFMAPLDETHTTLHDYLKSLTGKDAEEFSPERIKICWRLVALVTDLFKHCNIAMRDLKPDNIGLFKTLLVHMDFGNGRFITLQQKTESNQRGADVIAPPETKKPGKHEYAYEDRWSLGANIMYILSDKWIGKLPGNNMDYKEMVDTAKKFAMKLNSPLGELLEGLIVINPRNRIDVVKFAEKNHLLATIVDFSRESRTSAIDKYMTETVPTIRAHMKELEAKNPAAKKVDLNISKVTAPKVHKEQKKAKEPVKKAIQKKATPVESEDKPVKKRVATPMPAKRGGSEEDSNEENESFSQDEDKDKENKDVNVFKKPSAAVKKSQTGKKHVTAPMKKMTRNNKVEPAVIALEESEEKEPEVRDAQAPLIAAARKNQKRSEEEIAMNSLLKCANGSCYKLRDRYYQRCANCRTKTKEEKAKIAAAKTEGQKNEEEEEEEEEELKARSDVKKRVATPMPVKKVFSDEENESDEEGNEEVNFVKTPPAAARKNATSKKAQTEKLKKTTQRKVAAKPKPNDESFSQNEEKESEEIEVLKKLLAAAKMKAIAKKSNKQIATLKPTKRDSEEESGEKNNSDEDENKENEETPPAAARKNVIAKKAQTEKQAKKRGTS